MTPNEINFDFGVVCGTFEENVVLDIAKELEDTQDLSTLVHLCDGRLYLSCYFDSSRSAAQPLLIKLRENVFEFVIKKLFEKLQETHARVAEMTTTDKKYLVDVLASCAKIDTSVARREIVLGEVTVNNEKVTDPAAVLVNEPGIVSAIGYRGNLYPFYP